MKLENTFSVAAPIDEVWEVLLDVETVASCVPGARIVSQISDDAYKVAMKIKIGPMSMEYRGEIQIIEQDADARQATLRGKAKEARGQGTAEATATLRRDDGDADAVQATVVADVKLSGRAAAMGQGIINDIANQMVGQFADCLQQKITAPELDDQSADDARSGADVGDAYDTAADTSPHDRVQRDADAAGVGAEIGSDVGRARASNGSAGATGGAGASVRGTAAVQREAAVSGAAQSAPGARASDRVAAGQRMPSSAARSVDGDAEFDNSLDALALARSVLMGRLQDPKAVLTLVLAVFGMGWMLGRRSGT